MEAGEVTNHTPDGLRRVIGPASAVAIVTPHWTNGHAANGSATFDPDGDGRDDERGQPQRAEPAEPHTLRKSAY